jgi:hypothetical protein
MMAYPLFEFITDRDPLKQDDNLASLTPIGWKLL